jgi:hypothetical protein
MVLGATLRPANPLAVSGPSRGATGSLSTIPTASRSTAQIRSAWLLPVLGGALVVGWAIAVFATDRAHDSELTVEPTPGGGATFSFHLERTQ